MSDPKPVVYSSPGDPVMTSALNSFPGNLLMAALQAYGYTREFGIRAAYVRFCDFARNELTSKASDVDSAVSSSDPASLTGAGLSLEAKLGGGSGTRADSAERSVPGVVQWQGGGACAGAMGRRRRAASGSNVDREYPSPKPEDS